MTLSSLAQEIAFIFISIGIFGFFTYIVGSYLDRDYTFKIDLDGNVIKEVGILLVSVISSFLIIGLMAELLYRIFGG